jgi:hypothetical protein
MKETVEADNQSPEWATKVLAALAAVLALISPAVAALAGAGGGSQRMLRNEWPLTAAAAAAIGFGFLLILFAFIVLTSVSAKKNAYSARLFAAASVLIIAGLGAVLLSAGRSAGLREEPSVAAALVAEPSLHLDATVTASGLRADERLNIHVYGYRAGAPGLLYSSVTGPNESGQISLAITLPIDPATSDHIQISIWQVGKGEPDCNQAESGARADAACALFAIPAPTNSGAPN